MSYFTKAEILEIENALAARAVKDSELPKADELKSTDLIPIISDNKNKVISANLISNSASSSASTSADAFYVKPKIYTQVDRIDKTDPTRRLYIVHPCKGLANVDFVLMNKSKRHRGFTEKDATTGKWAEQTITHNGWTVARNFRRAALSYGESMDEAPICVIDTDNAVTAYKSICDFAQKYYMYPQNETNTDVDTENMDVYELYFGGWARRESGTPYGAKKDRKRFGIAARRKVVLSNKTKYEYSDVADIMLYRNANILDGVAYLSIGVL